MSVPYKLNILLNKLKEADCGPIRKEGDEFRCRCPAHDDNGPSLYLAVAEGKILINCKAGCTAQAVCDRLDHDMEDLFFDTDEPWVEPETDFSTATTEVSPQTTQETAVTSETTVPTDNEPDRNAIYSELLAHLELSMAHFEALRQRGLSANEISLRCYRTIDPDRSRQAVDNILNRYTRNQVLTTPGFCDRNGRVFFQPTRGLLIPVRDLTQGILALKVRHDSDANGPKYTWASSKGVSSGSPVHVPLGVPVPSQTVRLTEGELKADVATALSKVPTISAPGVTTWHLAVPVLKALGARKVLLAMDQDGKPGTLVATEKALYGLTREGFEVELEYWDGKVAKGIDDLLAAGGQPEVLTGLAAAVHVQDALAPPVPESPETSEPEPEVFPVDVFPPPLATFCREVAEATSTPPDFAGLAMLITAGAAIGNSRALCLKDNVWYESARFYGANVGDPASGKTPAMDAVVKPYQSMQLRRIRDYKDAKARYDREKAEYDQAVRENRALPEGVRQSLPPMPEEPPKPERFVTVDATVESLAPVLEENPRGLLMPQDEGVAWVRGMGQYKGGRGNDRQFWLSNWSGKSHMVDRKSQGGVPISIPRPFVNVVCGLPPDMLNELADYQGRNDGFLHRVLFVLPRATAGTDWSDVTVSEDSKKAWETTLAGLRKLAMEELEDGVPGYRVVQFSPAAKQVWIDWWNRHAQEMRGSELPIQMLGPWGKLKAYAARLALVLHFLWLVQTCRDEGDLDVSSVERAIRLIDYFKAHLKLVYGRLRQTPEDNHLLEVLDWVRKKGGRCTARDLVHAKKVTPTEKARRVLKELEDRGYGRIDTIEAANGKRVQWFLLDPA